MPKYFALTQETLQEVLAHLSKDPVAGLYQKVAQALPVQEAPPVVETSGTDGSPASN